MALRAGHSGIRSYTESIVVTVMTHDHAGVHIPPCACVAYTAQYTMFTLLSRTNARLIYRPHNYGVKTIYKAFDIMNNMLKNVRTTISHKAVSIRDTNIHLLNE